MHYASISLIWESKSSSVGEIRSRKISIAADNKLWLIQDDPDVAITNIITLLRTELWEFLREVWTTTLMAHVKWTVINKSNISQHFTCMSSTRIYNERRPLSVINSARAR